MTRRILLPVILLILGFGFWISEDFKTVSAGVAIFLFGMLSLEEGFAAFTGGTLERLLRRTTSNRWKSLALGIVSTSIMQSSSLVSVIAISFLSAGLISLAAGIGIVFGANLGTTTGAWVIAGFGLKVDIASYALPMLVFGTVFLFQSSRKSRGVGSVLCGLGFLFLGIHYIKEGFDALESAIDLSRFAVSGFSGLLLFTLIGIVATVVMQSSHATLTLIITALAAAQITYENALALAIGSNVGTTITAILGSLKASQAGRRLAGAHLVFNLLTALIAIVLMDGLIDTVNWTASRLGIATDDYTLKLALFHSIFNIIGILVTLPFIEQLASALERAMPDKVPDVAQPKYLSSASAEFPDTAVEAVRNETLRVYEAAVDIVLDGLGIERSADGAGFGLDETFEKRAATGESRVDALYERNVKPLYSAIVAFISDTAFSRRDANSPELQWLRDANTQAVEAVKATKHLQKNLLPYVASDNPDIRKAYNALRSHVASTLEDIETTHREANGVMDMLTLDSLRLVIDEHRARILEEMTELIGRRRISPQMGTSLLNDSTYAHDVSTNLVLAAQTLFGTGERELLVAAKEVSLDDEERDEIRSGSMSARTKDDPERAGMQR